MISYNTLMHEALPGDTPRKQYENLIFMKKVMRRMAYPKVGEENENIFDYINEIADRFSLDDINEQ